MKERIFVCIASYRDKQLERTVRSVIENAEHPVGVCCIHKMLLGVCGLAKCHLVSEFSPASKEGKCPMASITVTLFFVGAGHSHLEPFGYIFIIALIRVCGTP